MKSTMMKASMRNKTRVPLRHTVFKTAACVTTLAALLALATTARARVEYDNFQSSGSGGFDPANAWEKIDNTFFPHTYSFPGPLSAGNWAFNLYATAPTNSVDGVNLSVDGYTTARAFAVATAESFSTTFYVAGDILNWNTNYIQDNNYAMNGLVARCNATVAEIHSGTNWDALGFFFWPNVDTQEGPTPPAAPGTAVIGIGYINDGWMDFTSTFVPPAHGVVPVALGEAVLEPGHGYRFVFQGNGADLTGDVYDLTDLTKPLLSLKGDTSAGALLGPAPTSGWSGFMSAYFQNGGGDPHATNDVTFDNFYAAASAPTTAIVGRGTPSGLLGGPQVINRTPASFSNFYAYTGGITFTATTLTTTNNINASQTKLIINGMDVSSGLTTTSNQGTNVVYSFGGSGAAITLNSNIVYDATIIVQDVLGRSSTNIWTFDTFNAPYLASDLCKNIECEDYDIATYSTAGVYTGPNGQSLDFPVPASGYSTNDNVYWVPVGLTPPPYRYCWGINIGNNPNTTTLGYVGQKGLMATNWAADNTTPGDYYCASRTGPLKGAPANINAISDLDLNNFYPGCEYRTGGATLSSAPNLNLGNDRGDAVGTEEGAGNGIFINQIVANAGDLFWSICYDNKRSKYADLNPLGLTQYPIGGALGSPYDDGCTGANANPWWDVEEYNVMATEGSDWMNYTHDFGATKSYNVYLRAACFHSQYLNLYDAATTNRANLVGVFSNYNTLPWNWRYAPLQSNGTNAVVALGGTKTLRLEVDPDKPNWVEIRRGLAMNYMAFVPAGTPQLVTNIVVVLSTTNKINSVAKGATAGTFTVTARGTVGAQYYLVSSGNIKTAMGSWTPVTGSTNTATSPNGIWTCTVSNSSPAYYRAVAVNPAP